MATDDYDDDDRPRRPRNSRDDEDDAPRRRRDEDDDYDDSSRRSGKGLAPHKGVVILVLGIIGLCCGLSGIIAFILGLIDISKMNKGQMDPSGKGLTMAGTIIGIIGFVLNCAGGIYFNANPNAFK